MEDQNIKKLALIVSANCTRQSTIEECQKMGQINDQQYSQINKEMSDRIYTFLTYLLQKPADEYTVMLEAMAKHFPENQDMPELSQFILQQSQNSGSAASQQH
ncbi:hypothetical protein [Endozoicomonas ascidiicola]|uniref:hypothetical protein n=1 Tax=Endozoicomonas ascidiicola TaxID=1698521 RepID=UPI000829D69A|nr:hypothetical protein [Endozoicomonas ascidiicola]